MLSLLKLPIVVISYDFVVSGLAASPGASLCCASEDSRAIAHLLEVVDETACLVFLIGMIEQEVFDLLKVACFANVENHTLITTFTFSQRGEPTGERFAIMYRPVSSQISAI